MLEQARLQRIAIMLEQLRKWTPTNRLGVGLFSIHLTRDYAPIVNAVHNRAGVVERGNVLEWRRACGAKEIVALALEVLQDAIWCITLYNCTRFNRVQLQ